jgi:serine/threonine protein kinase
MAVTDKMFSTTNATSLCPCTGDVVTSSSLLPPSPPRQNADQYATRALAEFRQDSHLLCCSIPSVNLSVLDVGEDIGKGGFAIVKEVEMNGKHYAMKHLRPSICTSRNGDQFSVAVADLLKEAEFESAFKSHPHIISIHAKHISHQHMEENFIIIDRLTETLEQRMASWQARESSQKTKKCHTLEQSKQFLCERLQICLDICETLQYLHNLNVIYRDLKAENLGFDADGNVKLFDFGLAKELKDDLKSNNGKYKLSGKTGSAVYMAPEVAKCWNYNNKVDVYSFGVLLWEMTALKQAYMLQTKNAQGEINLPMSDWWPDELQGLIKNCCSYFANARPDFEVVKKELKGIMETLRKEGSVVSGPRGITPFRFPMGRGREVAAATDKRSIKQNTKDDHVNYNRRTILQHLSMPLSNHQIS